MLALRTRPVEHFESDGEAAEQELRRIDTTLGNLNDKYTDLAEGAISANIRNPENFERWLDIVIKMQREIQCVHEAIQQLREPPEGRTLKKPDPHSVFCH